MLLKSALAIGAILVAMLLTSCGPLPKGDTGAQGAPGQVIEVPPKSDIPDVSVVQLCPGTSTYGQVYVEEALCIKGQLHAIYSTVSTLVVLPPGEYASASIGSACNFTVQENCVVVSH